MKWCSEVPRVSQTVWHDAIHPRHPMCPWASPTDPLHWYLLQLEEEGQRCPSVHYKQLQREELGLPGFPTRQILFWCSASSILETSGWDWHSISKSDVGASIQQSAHCKGAPIARSIQQSRPAPIVKSVHLYRSIYSICIQWMSECPCEDAFVTPFERYWSTYSPGLNLRWRDQCVQDKDFNAVRIEFPDLAKAKEFQVPYCRCKIQISCAVSKGQFLGFRLCWVQWWKRFQHPFLCQDQLSVASWRVCQVCRISM